MRKRTLATVAATALFAMSLVHAAKEPHAKSTQRVAPASPSISPSKSGYVAANGLRYYYEIYGEGEPLLLLHGGLGNIGMFTPILPGLAANRQVIGVDLHGHGRTELGDRNIDLVDIGNDLAIVLTELGYEQVDALGYSFGGGAAFRLAAQHPQKVRRLVLVSAGYAQDGYYPEILQMQKQVGAAMADQMKDTPMYESYARVAPRPEDFPKLLGQMGAFMSRPYDWSADVKNLAMPVMIVFGDGDMYRLEHVVKFYQLLGGGLRDAGWMREHMSKNRLAIVPGQTHYDIFFSPRLTATVLPFLNGDGSSTSWEDHAAEK